MKPLNNFEAFLERFVEFKDGEFRSIEVISPLQMKFTFAVQDVSRGFDWLCIELEFNGITDARLVDDTKLGFVDMSEGVSIIKESDTIAFAVGACYNVQSAKNSTCYVTCQNVKYEEKPF